MHGEVSLVRVNVCYTGNTTEEEEPKMTHSGDNCQSEYVLTCIASDDDRGVDGLYEEIVREDELANFMLQAISDGIPVLSFSRRP